MRIAKVLLIAGAVTAVGVLNAGQYVASADSDGHAPRTTASSSRSPRPSSPSGNGGTTDLANHPGKVLASNCFQCHGTDGKNGQFDSLAGESSSELYEEIKELQTETDPEEAIMAVHARGYTDEQIRQISDYFSRVR